MECRYKYRSKARPLVLLIFLLLNTIVCSQQQSENDTLLNRTDIHLRIWENQSVFQSEIPGTIFQKLRPHALSDNDRNPFFYDSLKAKASKHLITKKLYDFVIVSGKSSSGKQITGTSDRDYLKYSGKIIRKIDIKRLSVFGTDINNPLVYDARKINNLINRTHVNTNEQIIRKNLLFAEGDTLSPLILSDNERLLRQLPYIDDSRILVVSESEEYVDIMVLTKDVYSLGGSFEYKTVDKGSVSLYDKNIFGFGHELKLKMSYDPDSIDSPAFGLNYNINNIARSFINLNLYYRDGLGLRNYGIGLNRKLLSSTTKYAGGISVSGMFTSEDLDTLPEPEPLKYTLQDYWLSRSFLINKENVARFIIGARYTNNNVFDHPYILPDSYHDLQRYKMLLGSAALSFQRFYKTNLIYGYGRTEDIPFGGLVNFTAGKEINEFKQRLYTGIFFSTGHSLKNIGYFYSSSGFSMFFNEGETEQGQLFLRTSYVSNLLYVGTHQMRNFVKIDYTRGFGRYTDEYLLFNTKNGFSGFRNDSLRAARQRLTVNLESVLFSPGKIYGFRFAYFGFADLGYLFGTNEFVSEGEVLSRIGLGIRLRNDNLVFNTFQIRLCFYPNLPRYSKVTYFNISGEQLLNPDNFEPGPPSLLPYR